MAFLFLAFCLTSSAWASPLELQVVSYNIKGLPSFVMSGEYGSARYPLIGKILADKKAEIVLLQEAFSDEVPSLLKAAAYPHQSEGPRAAGLMGVGSGLYILSKYPIIKEAQEVFGAKNCLSYDCFSNKGVQMVRVSVPGLPLPLEIYNTHLQAGREDSVARVSQVKTLVSFFKANHQLGNPVVFAGDFNFRPGLGQKSYLDFVEGTTFLHAGKFCLENGCSKVADDGWHGIWARAVDHQFYSKLGVVKLLPLAVERSLRAPVDGVKLSDHPTLEVRYQVSVESEKPAAPTLPSPVKKN